MCRRKDEEEFSFYFSFFVFVLFLSSKCISCKCNKIICDRWLQLNRAHRRKWCCSLERQDLAGLVRLSPPCAAANTVPRKPDILYSNIYSVHFVTTQKSVGHFTVAKHLTRCATKRHDIYFQRTPYLVFGGCIFCGQSRSIRWDMRSILNGIDAKRAPIDSIKFVRLISTEHGRNDSNANDNGPSNVLSWHLRFVCARQYTGWVLSLWPMWHLQILLHRWQTMKLSHIWLSIHDESSHTIKLMEYRSEASLPRSRNQIQRNANEWMNLNERARASERTHSNVTAIHANLVRTSIREFRALQTQCKQ